MKSTVIMIAADHVAPVVIANVGEVPAGTAETGAAAVDVLALENFGGISPN